MNKTFFFPKPIEIYKIFIKKFANTQIFHTFANQNKTSPTKQVT